MIFIENPSGGRAKMAKGRTKSGKIKRGYRLTAGGRVVKATGSKRKRSGSKKRKGNTRKRTTRRRNMARRRRRRNQPIVKRLTDGTVHAFQAVLGKYASRTLPTMLNIPSAGATGIAMQAVVALVVGEAAHRFINKDAGSFVLAGALMAPLESALDLSGIPFLSELSAYPHALNAYPHTLGQYREASLLPSGQLGAYAEDVVLDGQQYGY